MKKRTIILLVVVVVIVAILATLGGSIANKYNDIISLQESISSSYAEIENQLLRRFELIPDLVNVANRYAEHEEEIYTQIANARAAMTSAGNMNDKLAANSELSSAISRLLVVQEAYPDLKVDRQYIAVMDEMAGTENRIAVARRSYNQSVQAYNTEIKKFPGKIVADYMGAEEAEYFEIDEEYLSKPEYNL